MKNSDGILSSEHKAKSLSCLNSRQKKYEGTEKKKIYYRHNPRNKTFDGGRNKKGTKEVFLNSMQINLVDRDSFILN